MDCPNCGATLRERDRAGIKVDFCADCKGVWLDRGELDKIVQRELEDAEPAAAVVETRERYVRDDDDDDDDDRRGRSYGGREEYERYERKPKSKKKSFFESLTDMVGGD